MFNLPSQNFGVLQLKIYHLTTLERHFIKQRRNRIVFESPNQKKARLSALWFVFFFFFFLYVS